MTREEQLHKKAAYYANEMAGVHIEHIIQGAELRVAVRLTGGESCSLLYVIQRAH